MSKPPRKRQHIWVVLSFLAGAWAPLRITAQCVMCRSTVASQAEQTGNLGEGLNVGILYLLFIPYAAIFIVGWLWSRKKR